MLRRVLLSLFCGGREAVVLARETATVVDGEAPMELARGLAWTGEGDFAAFHRNHSVGMGGMYGMTCMAGGYWAGAKSSCWELKAFGYRVTPPTAISPLVRCPRWGRCVVTSDPAAVAEALASVWSRSAAESHGIPTKLRRLLPEKPAGAQFAAEAPAGTSVRLYIKFLLLQVELAVRLNPTHLVPSKPESRVLRLSFPISTPTGFDAVVGVASSLHLS